MHRYQVPGHYARTFLDGIEAQAAACGSNATEASLGVVTRYLAPTHL